MSSIPNSGAAATPLVYCHGLPGLPGELAAFAPPELAAESIAVSRLDRGAISYRDAVLAAFDKATAEVEGQCLLLGFSLGAMAALHIAKARPERLSRVILASPAAPLELGDFLPTMAGRPVFEAAARGDLSIRALSAAQALALAVNWKGLRSAMFRDASPAERSFVSDPAVEDAIRSALQECLGPLRAAYRRELIAYVRPWAAQVQGITSPIEIWQGAADTWTPPSMAKALCEHLGTSASLRLCDGLGHYSTLAQALRPLKPRANP